MAIKRQHGHRRASNIRVPGDAIHRMGPGVRVFDFGEEAVAAGGGHMTRVFEPIRCSACGSAVTLDNWAADLCLVAPAGQHRLTGQALLALTMRLRLEEAHNER